MPELPEVEYTRRNLTRWMRGARIQHVATSDARIVRPKTPRAFVRALTGRTVERIERRGKWLRLTLDDGLLLFLHLGMTGWFERVRREAKPRHERVDFELTRHGRPVRVAYVDLRRWGRMVVTEDDLPTWTTLGPDPLETKIDRKALAARLARRKKRSIKEALMDQSVLAGIGNVQATEALWKARIDPRAKASSISKQDLTAIAAGLRWTIRRTLADLAKGDAAEKNPLLVYGRKGEPCPRCGTPLENVRLGGRTTTFCPRCQSRRARSFPDD